MATTVVDFFCYGATQAGYAFAHYACRGGGKCLVAEWTGHKGGTPTGGLGVGDWDTPRWGKTKEVNVWIGRERMGLTDGSEIKDVTAKSMYLAFDAVYLAGNPNIEIRVNCRLKQVYKEPASKAIYMIELENGDFVLARYHHDASYEVDLARMAGVKMRQGRDSYGQFLEPVENPDEDGLLSMPGYNPDLPPEPFGLYDTRGDRLWIACQPPRNHLKVGDSVPVSQANGWRFEYEYHPQGEVSSNWTKGIPFSKPSGWTEADSRRIIDLRTKTTGPLASDTKTAAGTLFPFGGSARPLELPLEFKGACKKGTNGCDLPGAWTNGWLDMSYDERLETARHAAWITMGSKWVCQFHPSSPQNIKDAMARFRLVDDVWQEPGDYTEFPGWPPQWYVRDGGGIWGQFLMTAKHAYPNPDSANGKWNFDDSVTTGGYHFDIHTPYFYCRPDGYGQKEGQVHYNREADYGVPLRCMLPDYSQCSNLTVSWGASGTAIWRSSWRMEQTVARGAQACGMLMDLANRGRNGVSIPISQVPFSALKALLDADGAVYRL